MNLQEPINTRAIDRGAEALKNLLAEQGSRSIADGAWVRGLLDALQKRFLKDPAKSRGQRLEIQSLPGTSILDRLEILNNLDSSNRQMFFDLTINRAMQGNLKGSEFLAAVLNRAGYYLSPSERLETCKKIASYKPRGTVATCLIALTKSAKSLKEAHKIINECDRARLMSYHNKEIREFVTNIAVVSCLRELTVPNPISSHVSNLTALDRAAENLKNTFRAAYKVVGEQRDWGHRATLQFFGDTLKETAKRFAHDYIRAQTSGEKNLILRSHRDSLQMELQYGTAFTVTAPSDKGKESLIWGTVQLAAIKRAIQRIGEFSIISDPNIREFRRDDEITMKYDGINTVAEYVQLDSIVYLSRSAFGNDRQSLSWRAGRTPEELIIHELAHAKSLQAVGYVGDKRQKISELIRADHFPEVFLLATRFQTETRPYTLDLARDLVFIKDADGKKHTITLHIPYHPEAHRESRKEARVYSYLEDHNLLVYYEPRKGQFTPREDGRRDPTEELAETYVAYFGDQDAVRHLEQRAPLLFRYMNSLYHRYPVTEKRRKRLRAALSPNSAVSHVQDSLKSENAIQSIFRLLTTDEQKFILGSLGVNKDTLTTKLTTPSSRSFEFNRLAKRSNMTTTVADTLMPILSQYNSAVLIARALLAKDCAVSVASLRGSKEDDPNSQDPLIEELFRALGGKLRQQDIFLLFHHQLSQRLKGRSFQERLTHLITEKLTGISKRNEQVKSVDMYKQVFVYTGLQPVANYLRRYASNTNLKGRLKIINTNAITSEEAAKRLLRGSLTPPADTLHFFTLEGTLMDLGGEIKVRDKERPIIYRRINLSKFIERNNPNLWLREVAREYDLPIRQLQIDDSDFTHRANLRLQLIDGTEENRMYKIKKGS
jgi:hypothetical protein